MLSSPAGRRYSLNKPEDLKASKDIRIYGMAGWFHEIFVQLSKARSVLKASSPALPTYASAAYDVSRVKHCLCQAGFGDRLASLPKGTETCLYKDYDKDGIEISGGEAQKIALARALYKDAPFIILDEPTAALDPISEYEIYSRFNEIAVFDNGEIVQTGSHDTLLAEENGKYYELWRAQAQYYTASQK